ncbi:MAG: hypothetical protein CVU35_00835 [Betaproteobacteria bacterium HGW-Betaproteobacteria-8]|nr:MAG: hypothetical protein CVU35_00835 [Betaproteobacteria bacterium HGW-Betaproteobacteria-8]
MDKSARPMKLFSLPPMFCLLVALFAMPGCAQLPHHSGKNDEAGSTTHTHSAQADYKSILAFSQEFPKLTQEAQRRELATLNQTAAYNAQSKLLLAMAYGLPSSHLRDTAKAQTLLDEIAADKRLDEESLTLAAIMRDYIYELSKSTQKAKEEQKRADATQQKLDELQKKLDDLKNIEKTMVDRNQGVKK